VSGLEKEVQRQTELRVMYKKRMEKTQDYLKYCLQIAQENGILDLIIRSKGEVSQSPLSPHAHALNSTPTPSHNHPNLMPIIHQAKINGWFINPNEVTNYFLSSFSAPIQIWNIPHIFQLMDRFSWEKK